MKTSEFGIWVLVLGIWSLGFGIWNLEFGIWNLEFGAWKFKLNSLLRNSWFRLRLGQGFENAEN